MHCVPTMAGVPAVEMFYEKGLVARCCTLSASFDSSALH